MNPFTLLQSAISAANLWHTYGSAVEKAVSIIKQIDAIDGGGLFEKVEKVLKSNGVDVAALMSAAGSSTDLTTIKGIQNGLNLLLKPNPPLAVDGDYGALTFKAMMQYQDKNGQDPNGVPFPNTMQMMASQLSRL